jgi:tetratricopeptide (TPR) repeat protein
MKRHGAPLAAVLAFMAWTACAQQTQAPQPSPAKSAPSATPTAKPANTDAPKKDNQSKAVKPKPVRPKDRRRAAKLYLAGSKLFEKEQFDRAMQDYQSAAKLDPNKPEYSAAAELARSHEVTALIQAAAKARGKGDPAAARAAIAHARELDPTNPQVTEHLYELADDSLSRQTKPIYEQVAATEGQEPALEPTASLQSFHLKLDRRQMAQRVYKAFGIDATIDQSVSAVEARLDVDNVDFLNAVNVLNMVTGTFAVPLDAHRVIVARDTRDNRQQFERQELETVYLPGLTATEMTEVSNIAKNVFGMQQVSVEQNLGTVTLRATQHALNAFNVTVRDLVNGRSQVLLDVQIIQIAHTKQRNTGTQLPQQVTAVNLYSEEQSILNANQALVQQIISSGLAAPGDTLAILGILLASGQVSSSLFTNGIALFGGGITLSGVSPGPTTFNLSLNSSDSRELDSLELRLADGEDETIRSGMRYPILQASVSGLGTNGANIPGLTSAGTSSGLSSLLSSISGQATQVPQINYQDIGLTMKTNPRVMRSGDVALTVDLKITSLSGSSVDNNPVINNRSYSGVVTLKSGEGTVLMSELDKSESRALSGTPGLSEIPGLNNLTDKDVQSDYATLLIVLTPHLVRAPQEPLNVQPIRVERTSQAQAR